VEALEVYGLDPARRELPATEVLGRALDWVLSGGRVSGPASRRVLLGSGLDERGLRFGLERSYRTPARLASGGEERTRPGGTCQPLPPPTMGVVDVADAPAGRAVELPELRGAARTG
jgi:hypothetical protein